MLHLRTRSTALLRSFLLALTGSATIALAASCGGTTAAAPTDTGTTATTTTSGGDSGTDGISIVDSAADTSSGTGDDSATATGDDGSSPLDGFTIDPDASLFEISVPDVMFGDISVPTCFSCIEVSCKDQLAACDKDPACKGTIACVIDSCSFSDTACLLGCAGKSGASLGSKAATEAIAVATCARGKVCGPKCGG